MKIKEAYLVNVYKKGIFYRFDSSGQQGIIKKWIWFQQSEFDENRYNLAFGDLIDGELTDDTISNNQDFVKVISTVVYVIYYFFELYPNAIIEIDAVDKRRLRFYRTIFKRRFSEINQTFHLRGIKDDQIEPYNSSSTYQKFELELKK